MANEAIIRAAGQRYASPKIDYSGYIQGLASITSALIEKRKNILKKNETFGKLAMKADHPNLEHNLTFLRDKIYSESPEGMNITQSFLERVVKNDLLLYDPKTQEDIKDSYENMSLSVDLEKMNHWNTMLSGDFKDKRQVIVGEGVELEREDGTISTTYTTLDNLLSSGVYDENEIIEIIKKEGLRDVIMGVDGNYIDVEDFIPNIRQDIGIESNLYKEIDRTIDKLMYTKESSAANRDPEGVWIARKNKSLKKIKNMVSDTKNEDILLSAMTDLEYPIGVDLVPEKAGSEDNFMDWILAVDEDFLLQWNDFLETKEGLALSGETLEKSKAVFINSLYEADNRLVDEYMKFIDAVYMSYYN